VGGGGWSVSKNDDGSYTVKKDTDELAVGDEVLVAGTLTGDVATAMKIASRPGTGELPGLLMKRLEGEFGDREGLPMLKDRLMKRFEGGDKLIVPGPMGGRGGVGPGGMGPGEEMHRFEFPSPERAEASADDVVTG
jgi:hypothetical protein